MRKSGGVAVSTAGGRAGAVDEVSAGLAGVRARLMQPSTPRLPTTAIVKRTATLPDIMRIPFENGDG
jgi:hypothetical protein